MKDTSSIANKKLVKDLQGQVKKLQSQLKVAQKVASDEDYVAVRVTKTQSRFKRVRKPEGRDVGIGEFLLLLDVTAMQEAVYVPLSIASGKKPTGFVYQIEGTAKGDIASASVISRGKDLTLITLGSILYCKIPKGKTGTFRIRIEIRGRIGKTYKIAINRVHFKLDPEDPRYKKSLKALSTKPVQFS